MMGVETVKTKLWRRRLKAKQDVEESDDDGDDDMAGDHEVEDLSLEDLDLEFEIDDELGAADIVEEDIRFAQF
jgi:hypothetical protein